ncbi:hypothetical protein GGX14DRAFT_562779 [Mycena pura]|uniref:Uncharacterized protein n=1 Tax=Mycena pura TaxID=153505 RepID=A0AAD6VKD3_9AGAR|nr:hypothetical protein GGX14DRAFT_562779 [Mycena pura]
MIVLEYLVKMRQKTATFHSGHNSSGGASARRTALTERAQRPCILVLLAHAAYRARTPASTMLIRDRNLARRTMRGCARDVLIWQGWRGGVPSSIMRTRDCNVDRCIAPLTVLVAATPSTCGSEAVAWRGGMGYGAEAWCGYLGWRTKQPSGVGVRMHIQSAGSGVRRSRAAASPVVPPYRPRVRVYVFCPLPLQHRLSVSPARLPRSSPPSPLLPASFARRHVARHPRISSPAMHKHAAAHWQPPTPAIRSVGRGVRRPRVGEHSRRACAHAHPAVGICIRAAKTGPGPVAGLARRSRAAGSPAACRTAPGSAVPPPGPRPRLRPLPCATVSPARLPRSYSPFLPASPRRPLDSGKARTQPRLPRHA